MKDETQTSHICFQALRTAVLIATAILHQSLSVLLLLLLPIFIPLWLFPIRSNSTAESLYFPNSLIQTSSDSFPTLFSSVWLCCSAAPSWEFIWHHPKRTKDQVIFLITLPKINSCSSGAMLTGKVLLILSNQRILKEFFLQIPSIC